ncbi:MAG: rhodanese-like domain-containing protein [Rhodocyclaceae bacterium]|nr:rhodanese-like domain-containing protein [Rhodocyclaceae bacterium]
MKKTLLSVILLAMSSTCLAEIVTIEVEDLGELVSRGVPLVDVRTAGEWQETGIVPGSRTLTYFDEQGRSDPEAWMREFQSIAGPDDEVAIICRSGARSRAVAEFLDKERRYSRVYTVGGGVVGWKALGRPTVDPQR